MIKQKGFTLIELMVVVMIVAILAAIAIPNYQRYVVKNAEEEVKAQIGQLELQLQRWRASALTYKGFVPANSSSTYGYGSNNRVTANTIIYLPIGSDETNYRYMIELVDIESRSGGSRSLLPTASNASDATLGRGWKLVAYPNSSLASKDARRFLATSSGLRCAVVNSRGSQMTLNTTSCTNLETW